MSKAGREVHGAGADGSPRADAALAAALASRICHDLVSPLGAIANGVELLGLSSIERSPEMDLIADSVGSASARLRFFRYAFGVGGAQTIGRPDIVRLLATLGHGGRIAYAWDAAGDPSRNELKAVFLAIQCCEAAMPLGGRIRVGHEDGRWTVRATGPRLRHDLPAWASLQSDGEIAVEGAATIQFALLPLHLATMGRCMARRLGPDSLDLSF